MQGLRAVEVPGGRVIEAYCKLVDDVNATANHTEAERIAEARLAGFRQAVEIYCPDTPHYSCTAGYLMMAADRYSMDKYGEDADMIGGVLSFRTPAAQPDATGGK